MTIHEPVQQKTFLNKHLFKNQNKLNYYKEKLSPYKFKDSKILLLSQQKSANFFFIKVFDNKLGSLSYPIFLPDIYFCNFPLRRPDTPVAFFWAFFLLNPLQLDITSALLQVHPKKIHLCQFTQYTQYGM